MTNLDFDAEIDRLKLYMDAYVEVCFVRPEQRWYFPPFDKWAPGQKFKEQRIYRRDDGSYIVAERTYRSIYSVPYDFGPWVVSDPVEPVRPKQQRLEWDLNPRRAIANFRAERKAEQLERLTR